jgi:hypothetical protein
MWDFKHRDGSSNSNNRYFDHANPAKKSAIHLATIGFTVELSQIFYRKGVRNITTFVYSPD